MRERGGAAGGPPQAFEHPQLQQGGVVRGGRRQLGSPRPIAPFSLLVVMADGPSPPLPPTHHIFSRNVPARALGIGAAPEPRHRRIDHRDSQLQRGQHVGQALPVGVMHVRSELGGRHMAESGLTDLGGEGQGGKS